MSLISQKIQQHWQIPCWWLSIILCPLSWIFGLIALLRRFAYQHHIFKSQNLPVPVVIIGNIYVGGTGKTPVLIELANQLDKFGIKTGIVSRGYGRQNQETLIVDPNGSAKQYGDEPLMIAQQTKAPVAVSRSRFEAGQLLLQHYPDTQLIISDDGLQHYALDRQLEIAVINQKIGLGNTNLLPNGPLREPASRLNNVQALIITDAPDKKLPQGVTPSSNANIFYSSIKPQRFYSLHAPDQQQPAEYFSRFPRIAAMAGIGQPEKFLTTLHELNIHPSEFFPFPDHHHYQTSDIPKDFDVILTTQKDAVKLQSITSDNIWVLPVSVTIEPDFSSWVKTSLGL